MNKRTERPVGDRRNLKWLGLAILAIVVAVLYWQFGSYLRLDWLAQQETQLRALQSSAPLVVIGSAFLLYVAVTGLSLPGATLLTLAVSWYFGFWPALVLVSLASTSGATVAFLLSRYFFRETVERRFGERLKSFDEALEREGAFYLLSLRLMPAVPFFVINAVMGLTKLRVSTYWWVSQLGMLPGTCVYVYAGSRVPDLQTLSDEGIKAVFTAESTEPDHAGFCAPGRVSGFGSVGGPLVETTTRRLRSCVGRLRRSRTEPAIRPCEPVSGRPCQPVSRSMSRQGFNEQRPRSLGRIRASVNSQRVGRWPKFEKNVEIFRPNVGKLAPTRHGGIRSVNVQVVFWTTSVLTRISRQSRSNCPSFMLRQSKVLVLR